MRIISILILTLLTATAHSQQNGLSAELRPQYGFIIPHRDGLKNLIQGHVKEGEVLVERQTTGSKHWEKAWLLPRVGLGLFVADLGNPRQLGWSTALYPYIRFKVNGGKNVRLNYRLGAGVGYISKVFDEETNYKNVMIGSHLNMVASMVGELEIDVTERLRTSFGFGLTHYSNGAFTIPNLGLNIPAISLGLNYNFKTNLLNDRVVVDPPIEKYGIIVYGLAGLKENYPVGSRKYGSYSLSADFYKRFGYRSRLVGTLDFFYNTSLKPRMIEEGMSVKNEFEVMQQGFMLSYQVLINRVAVVVGNGVYLNSKFKDDGLFYHRIGVQYKLNDKWVARWTLKTHLFRADHFEMGFGYRLK